MASVMLAGHLAALGKTVWTVTGAGGFGGSGETGASQPLNVASPQRATKRYRAMSDHRPCLCVPKRQRAGAVQDSGEPAHAPGQREASRSAVALYRFGRGARRTGECGTPHKRWRDLDWLVSCSYSQAGPRQRGNHRDAARLTGRWARPWTSANTAGSTSSVAIVAETRPPITARTQRGGLFAAFAQAQGHGAIPATIARLVIRIGRSRLRPPPQRASAAEGRAGVLACPAEGG